MLTGWVSIIHSQNITDLLQVVNFTSCCNLSTICNRIVNLPVELMACYSLRVFGCVLVIGDNKFEVWR